MGDVINARPEPMNDWHGFYDELRHETPRAAVLLAAAFLDVHLRQLIANFMVEQDDKAEEVNNLLGTGKRVCPLSDFGTRILTAYCLGLITQNEYDDLKKVKQIRNEFAHGLQGLSMDKGRVRNWCNDLKIYGMLTDAGAHFPNDPCTKFLLTVSYLASRIAMAALSIGAQRRVVPPEVRVEVYSDQPVSGKVKSESKTS